MHDKPGPVALRIAVNFAKDSNEPVVLVLCNEIRGQLINGVHDPGIGIWSTTQMQSPLPTLLDSSTLGQAS